MVVETSRRISMAIAKTKTARRNIAFKVARMREAIMEDQDDELIKPTRLFWRI